MDIGSLATTTGAEWIGRAPHQELRPKARPLLPSDDPFYQPPPGYQHAVPGTVLRSRAIAAEVAPSAQKYGKQIRYAERRGIPFVWFPGLDGAVDEVKDIRSGEQVPADTERWSPPPADARPSLVTKEQMP